VGVTGEKLGGVIKAGRGEERGFATAGNPGSDLEQVHAATGEQSGGEKFRRPAIAAAAAGEVDDILAADLRRLLDGHLGFDGGVVGSFVSEASGHGEEKHTGSGEDEERGNSVDGHRSPILVRWEWSST
jgi:hypothetical protein